MSQHSDDFDNPYAAPQSAATGLPAPTSGDPAEQELRAFVGRRADYYLRRWTPLLQGTGGSGGLNWPAFLLCGVWLPYRKMYALAMIFYGAVLVSSLVEEVLFGAVLQKEPPAALDLALSVAGGAVCGVFANRWYLSRAQRVIAETRANGYQGEALLQTLAQRGGTSLAAGIGMFVLFVAANAVVITVLESLLFPE